ncbi:MAG: glycosyltransferase family 2 protein [Brasilonema angustatum HA4187-MV1]|jgi:glycosyltransferase involved in cell wall biosynthesis|nr:glycosyltransferase family 2 protein [Brasilonema angustatum HA4187-MV1]
MQNLQTNTLQAIALPPLPDNPLVSVIVPNYNYAKYIGETLESALRQTYPHFEVIVCDDGSTDNSCDIIANFVRKDSRIKLVCKQNGGVATALNAAYQESKGEIICVLDADDIWLDNKLQRVVEAFKSQPKFGFVIHNVIQIDGQGNLINSTPMLKQLASGWMASYALENGGWVDNIPPASALSVRREVGELIFPLNEEFKRNADSIIFRLAPCITEIGSVPEVLSQFRLHGANITSLLTLTVDSLEREHLIIARLHQEQKQFLKKFYGTEIAQKLTDWQSSLLVRHNLYLIARLKGASKAESTKAHQQLVTHPKFNAQFGSSIPQKLLLQWGEYLPKPVFSALFDLVYGSSRLKRFVKLLLRGKLIASRTQG